MSDRRSHLYFNSLTVDRVRGAYTVTLTDRVSINAREKDRGDVYIKPVVLSFDLHAPDSFQE